jgi:hypothetical protein
MRPFLNFCLCYAAKLEDLYTLYGKTIKLVLLGAGRAGTGAKRSCHGDQICRCPCPET